MPSVSSASDTRTRPVPRPDLAAGPGDVGPPACRLIPWQVRFPISRDGSGRAGLGGRGSGFANARGLLLARGLAFQALLAAFAALWLAFAILGAGSGPRRLRARSSPTGSTPSSRGSSTPGTAGSSASTRCSRSACSAGPAFSRGSSCSGRPWRGSLGRPGGGACGRGASPAHGECRAAPPPRRGHRARVRRGGARLRRPLVREHGSRRRDPRPLRCHRIRGDGLALRRRRARRELRDPRRARSMCSSATSRDAAEIRRPRAGGGHRRGRLHRPRRGRRGSSSAGAARTPLLASFAVVLGLLFWFYLLCTVLLLATAWAVEGKPVEGKAVEPENVIS